MNLNLNNRVFIHPIMNPDTLFASKQSISSPELKRMTYRQIWSFSAVIFQAVCWLPVPMKDSGLHHARRLMRVSVQIWAQMSRWKFDVPLKTGVPSLSKSSIKPPITLRLKLVWENFRSLMSRQPARYIQEINEKMEIVRHKGLNRSVERCSASPPTVRRRVLVNFANCLFWKRTFPHYSKLSVIPVRGIMTWNFLIWEFRKGHMCL